MHLLRIYGTMYEAHIFSFIHIIIQWEEKYIMNRK